MKSEYHRPIFENDNLKLSDFLKQKTYLTKTVLEADIPSEYSHVYFYFATDEKKRIDFFLILNSEDNDKLFCINGHIGINDNNNTFCATGLYSSFESILNYKEKLPAIFKKATEINKIYLFEEKLQIELVEKSAISKIKI